MAFVFEEYSKGAPSTGGSTIKEITFTDRPSLYAWFHNNVGKVVKASINTNQFPTPVIFTQVLTEHTEGTNTAHYVFQQLYGYFSSNAEIELTNFTVTETYSIMRSGPTGGSDYTYDSIPDEYWSMINISVTIYYIECCSTGAPSTGNEDDEAIVLVNDGSPYGVRNLYTYLCDAGLQCDVNTYLVDTLPDTLEPSSMTQGGTLNLYVVKSTGIVYGTLGEGTGTVGLLLFDSTNYDRGWTSELPERLDVGVFVMWKSDIFKDGNTIYLQPAEEEADEITLSPLDWVKVQADFKNTTICYRATTTFDGMTFYSDFVVRPTAMLPGTYHYGGIYTFGTTPQSVGVSIEKCVASFTQYGLEAL